MNREDVEFEGFGGVKLRGWLYLPDGGQAGGENPGGLAGVVMAHGFSGVKEMRLDAFAEVFCGAGLAALVYDHRGFGDSEGEPRQEINPWSQARDYRYAISWLGNRPEVDPDRIGIWGSSFSGGEVMVVAACDRRVKAAVANVPFAGLPGVDYGDPADVDARFERMRDAFLDESGAGPADRRDMPMGPMAVIAIEGEDRPAFLPQPESAQYFLESAEAGQVPSSWKNEVTVASLLSDPMWDPGVCASHIAPTAFLMVIASEDRLADTAVAQASFDRAREPKELVVLDGHHFCAYDGEPFERASGAAAEHLVKHL